MLINRRENISDNVKFVSYDGRFPNLCSGSLVLEIDDKEYKFGDNYQWNEELDDTPYDSLIFPTEVKNEI